jgi:hypothetical protein
MANDYGFRVVWKGYRDRGSWCCCWLVWFLRCCSRRNSACERGVASALTTPRLATRSLALPPSLQCSPCVPLYLCLYSFSEETMHAKYVAAPSQIAYCNRKGPHLSSDWCICCHLSSYMPTRRQHNDDGRLAHLNRIVPCYQYAQLDSPLTSLGCRHMAGYVKLRHFPSVIITGV